MSKIVNHTRAAGSSAWPLSAQDRQLAYAVANFMRRRHSQGGSEAVIQGQIRRIWPHLAPDILVAAKFLNEARGDGWPP
jgi:hypothetical protein